MTDLTQAAAEYARACGEIHFESAYQGFLAEAHARDQEVAALRDAVHKVIDAYNVHESVDIDARLSYELQSLRMRFAEKKKDA